MSVLAVVQARMGSSRLPGKVMKPLVGRPMLWHVVDRLRRARGVDRVVVATSDQPGDEPVRQFCRDSDITFFAGSEHDVLDRFYRAAETFAGDPLLRVTADCPFVDPELVGNVLALYQSGSYDHVGVATGAVAFDFAGPRYPDGLDCECFGFAALARAHCEAVERSDREHVTPFLYRVRGRFRNGMLTGEQDYGELRWTVDHADDFVVVEQVYQQLWSAERPFLMRDILSLFAARPELRTTNEKFVGTEGYHKVWNPT